MKRECDWEATQKRQFPKTAAAPATVTGEVAQCHWPMRLGRRGNRWGQTLQHPQAGRPASDETIETGRGVPEHFGVQHKVDIVTGTLGKALGGAMGGYTTGKKEIIEMLRQRSRPYLFSNSLAPAIVGASIKVFDLLSSTTTLRDRLEENTLYFKEHIIAAGFDIKPGDSPIVPIMLYDAALSQQFANELLNEGVYAIGFFYPVVAKGQARIRTQISAAHTRADLDKAIAAFIKVGKKLNVI